MFYRGGYYQAINCKNRRQIMILQKPDNILSVRDNLLTPSNM